MAVPKKRISSARSKQKRTASYFDFKLPLVRFSIVNQRWEPNYLYYRKVDKN